MNKYLYIQTIRIQKWVLTYMIFAIAEHAEGWGRWRAHRRTKLKKIII